MGILVEDGSGVAGANSYASEDTLTIYAEDRGITLADGDREAALIRSSAGIDATYRPRFPGVRSNGSAQGLQWPRKAGSIEYGVFVADGYLSTVTDAEGLPIDEDEIPLALVQAVCEAAIRELTSPGSLVPDLERGGAIKRLKAGSVEVEYATTAPASTTFSFIDGLLAGILTGGTESSPYTARAVRA